MLSVEQRTEKAELKRQWLYAMRSMHVYIYSPSIFTPLRVVLVRMVPQKIVNLP